MCVCEREGEVFTYSHSRGCGRGHPPGPNITKETYEPRISQEDCVCVCVNVSDMVCSFVE